MNLTRVQKVTCALSVLIFYEIVFVLLFKNCLTNSSNMKIGIFTFRLIKSKTFLIYFKQILPVG
jgi:hypothetical protein